MSTRLSVNINDETAKALRDLAAKSGTSVTEVVRRAVSAYKFLDDEVKEGVSLQLMDHNTKERTTLALL